MSQWDIENYREEHESDEHWNLRKAFILRWKNSYDEDRLLCLARVFINIELMGCRYPPEVMKEIAGLSEEVVKSYRDKRKNKLKRTFVSASDAAEDRAKGIKRQGGLIVESSPTKNARIAFVPQGHAAEVESRVTEISDDDTDDIEKSKNDQISTESLSQNNQLTSGIQDCNDYLKELEGTPCLDLRYFRENMFNTDYGMLVLMIKPWISKMDNIFSSCSMCKLERQVSYEEGAYKLFINNVLVAQALGGSKAEARGIVETIAWNKLRVECINVFVREQWIAQGDCKITNSDVTNKGASRTSQVEQFGTPIESSVATKMMKLMGWKGGGLGAGAQGIEEPVKPHLQMVNRAGLGSDSTGRHFHQAASALMKRYYSQDTLDVDLVFSSCFSKEERAKLHQIAKRTGLASHSYGKDDDRFLVVRKKAKDPFELVREVIGKGGNTAKYQIFIPNTLKHK